MPVSITEIKNRLPKEFMENLYEMFTPGMVDNILKGIIEKTYTTLRVNPLKYNVKMQGADIVEVVNGRGEKIGSQYKEQFDRVLLDTPCSGEGRFTAYDVQSYRVWSPKKVNELTKMQKKLFQSAYDALKPNGILVYSTCTLNKEENEYILDWALKNFNLKMVDIDINIKNAMPGINDGLEKDIKKSIRILPSKDMEGFFVSKFIKK